MGRFNIVKGALAALAATTGRRVVPTIAHDVNFGSKLVHWSKPSSYDGAGGDLVDLSGTGNDLTAGGTPTKGTDAYGDYILYDAGTEFHGSAAFTGIASGSQPWILAIADQPSGGAMFIGRLSDDGGDAGGLDFDLPSATDISATTQALVGATPINETYRYQHDLDTTVPHVYGCGYFYADLTMIVDGDWKPCCDVSDQGCRNGTTALNVNGAMTRVRVGGNYAGGAHSLRLRELLILNAAPTGPQVYEFWRQVAKDHPSVAANLRLTGTGHGVEGHLGQSNGTFTTSGAINGGTTLTQDGTDHLWGRLTSLPRPANVRRFACNKGGLALADWNASGLDDRTIEMLKATSPSDTITLRWYVGESDAGDATKAANFYTNAKAVIDQIASALGRTDVRHLIVRLHSQGHPTNMPYLSDVQSGMDTLDADSNYPHVSLIKLEETGNGVVTAPYETDLVHYTNDISRQLYARGCALAYADYGTSNWNLATHTLEAAFGFRLRECLEPSAATITESGGSISLAKHATFWQDWYEQATGAQQPTYNSSGGLAGPYISYPDATTNMQFTSHIPAGNRAVRIVIGRMSTGAGLALLCYCDGSNLQIGKESSKFKLQANFTGGNQNPSITTPALDASDHVFVIWPLSAGPIAQIDGVTTSASYTGTDTLKAAGNEIMGHSSVAGANFEMDGKYMIDDLTTAEWFATVVPYLNARYSTSLPTS